MGARSSAEEHYGDIVGVVGSNPTAPTIFPDIVLTMPAVGPGRGERSGSLAERQRGRADRHWQSVSAHKVNPAPSPISDWASMMPPWRRTMGPAPSACRRCLGGPFRHPIRGGKRTFRCVFPMCLSGTKCTINGAPMKTPFAFLAVACQEHANIDYSKEVQKAPASMTSSISRLCLSFVTSEAFAPANGNDHQAPRFGIKIPLKFEPAREPGL